MVKDLLKRLERIEKKIKQDEGIAIYFATIDEHGNEGEPELFIKTNNYTVTDKGKDK